MSATFSGASTAVSASRISSPKDGHHDSLPIAASGFSRTSPQASAVVELRVIVIPGFSEKIFGPQPLAKHVPLVVAEHVRGADLHRHVLAAGILLEVSGQREALQHVRADDHR